MTSSAIVESNTSSSPLMSYLDFTINGDKSTKKEKNILLYDPDSTLNINRDLANGFLILLSGGLNSIIVVNDSIKKKKLKNLKKNNAEVHESPNSFKQNIDDELTPDEESLYQLPFSALTDGNVIDTAFGIHSAGGFKRRNDTSVLSYNASLLAKMTLSEAAQSSEIIRKLAVETYCKCFEIVIMYHLDLEDLGVINWCYKHKKVRNDAEKSLRLAFAPLYKAVEASM